MEENKLDIAITGMGIVSTAGYELEDFWNNLNEGNISYGIVDAFNNSNYRVHIGAVIKDYSWENNIKDLEGNVIYGGASRYVASAVLRALTDAKLKVSDLKDARVALCIGTTMGEVDFEERFAEIKVRSGIDDSEEIRQIAKQYSCDNIAEAVFEILNLNAVYYVTPAACSGGNYAIVLGEQLLKDNKVDVVIAGGVDVFSRVAFTGFQRLLSLSPDYCRPFDKKRRGLVIGEGSGFVIMENYQNVKQRVAAHGFLLGTGIKSDRYHMVSPHPNGDGAFRAMEEAIHNAGIEKSEIDYISAHGTGTSSNDKIEAMVLERYFGEGKVPSTSSIKSMLGHSMGAASALECIASALMMEHGVMLPTVNLTEQDENVRFDCVPQQSREKQMQYVMSNSFAFGGQVGCIVLKAGDRVERK